MVSVVAIVISAIALCLNAIPALSSTLKVEVEPRSGDDATLVFTAYGRGLIWGIRYRRILNSSFNPKKAKEYSPWERLYMPLSGGQSTEHIPAWGSYDPPGGSNEYRSIEVRYWAFCIPRRSYVSNRQLIELDRVRRSRHYKQFDG